MSSSSPRYAPAFRRSSSRGSSSLTVKVIELLIANLLMLVLGCGLLPFLHLARTRRELVTRAPLGYAVGLAATGILGRRSRRRLRAGGPHPAARAGGDLTAPGPAPSSGRRPAAQGAARRAARARGARGNAPRCCADGEAACGQAARGAGRLGDLGDPRPRALRVRSSRLAGLHRSGLRGAPASSAPAGAGGDRLPLHGSLRRHACPPAASRPRDRVRRRLLDAAAGNDKADPARCDAARAGRGSDVRQPAADQLRRCPARHVRRARASPRWRAGSEPARRECCPLRRSSLRPVR